MTENLPCNKSWMILIAMSFAIGIVGILLLLFQTLGLIGFTFDLADTADLTLFILDIMLIALGFILAVWAIMKKSKAHCP